MGSGQGAALDTSHLGRVQNIQDFLDLDRSAIHIFPRVLKMK